jgi:APA family basic amino acid/polyamine antiporter
MRAALGARGASLIAGGIAISALGFLSQSILTAPRVYFAMARDGSFFKSLGWLHPRTRVPVVAIAVQGVCAMIIALTGTYEQILNYVISMDALFFGLSAACLFVFRHREKLAGAGPHQREEVGLQRVPGHPVVTLFFIATCWLIWVSTIYKFPANSLVGLGIAAAGVPVYFLWQAMKRKHA